MAEYLYSEKTGKTYAREPGGRLREATLEEAGAAGDNPLETFGKSAAVSAAQAWEGAKSLFGNEQAKSNLAQAERLQTAYGNVNPMAQMAGSVAPAVGVGLATAGAGLLPTMGVEAALGAAMSPEAPLQGAAIGGALGALPFGAMAAGRYAAREVPGMVQRLGDQLADPMLRGVAPRAGMPGRILSAIDEAGPQAAPPGQFYKGLMQSSQLDEAGVPLTPAMRMALDAPDSQTADYAKKLLWKEGLQGVGEQEKRGQRMYLTNLVKNEMGVTDDVALTDRTIGEVLKREGSNIGRILKTDADLNIPTQAIMDMRGIVETAETGWQGALANVVKNIENSVARNGALTPQAYQNAITKLGEIGAPGRSAGAIQDVKKLRDILSSQVEGGLPPAQKQLLAEARYRYKIAKTLHQGAGVGSDMMVNPASFGRNWDKKMAEAARGSDKIGQAADTMNFLATMEANAGTTLQRNIAQLPQMAARAAPPAIGAALGAPAAAAGWNALFGQ